MITGTASLRVLAMLGAGAMLAPAALAQDTAEQTTAEGSSPFRTSPP